MLSTLRLKLSQHLLIFFMSSWNWTFGHTRALLAIGRTCYHIKFTLQVLYGRRWWFFKNLFAPNHLCHFLGGFPFVLLWHVHRVLVCVRLIWWLLFNFTLFLLHIHQHLNTLFDHVYYLISIDFAHFLLFKFEQIFIVGIDFFVIPNFDWEIQL